MAVILRVMLMRRGIQKKSSLISSDTTGFKHFIFKISECMDFFFFFSVKEHICLFHIL